jgi:hypothetical protein
MAPYRLLVCSADSSEMKLVKDINYMVFKRAPNSGCLAARCIFNKKYSICFYLAIVLKEGGRYKKGRQ